MKYQFIIRGADNEVMDFRPFTIGIRDVINNQVVPNHGGKADDYRVIEIETGRDLSTPGLVVTLNDDLTAIANAEVSADFVAAQAAAQRQIIENRIIALRKDCDAARAEGLTAAAARIQAELDAARAELAALD